MIVEKPSGRTAFWTWRCARTASTPGGICPCSSGGTPAPHPARLRHREGFALVLPEELLRPIQHGFDLGLRPPHVLPFRAADARPHRLLPDAPVRRPLFHHLLHTQLEPRQDLVILPQLLLVDIRPVREQLQDDVVVLFHVRDPVLANQGARAVHLRPDFPHLPLGEGGEPLAALRERAAHSLIDQRFQLEHGGPLRAAQHGRAVRRADTVAEDADTQLVLLIPLETARLPGRGSACIMRYGPTYTKSRLPDTLAPSMSASTV